MTLYELVLCSESEYSKVEHRFKNIIESFDKIYEIIEERTS